MYHSIATLTYCSHMRLVPFDDYFHASTSVNSSQDSSSVLHIHDMSKLHHLFAIHAIIVS